MAIRRTLHTLLGAIITLALLMPVVSAPTEVGAAEVDEKALTGAINRMGRVMTRSGALGLQTAIWLSDVEECARNRTKADNKNEKTLLDWLIACLKENKEIPTPLLQSVIQQSGITKNSDVAVMVGGWLSNIGPATIDEKGHMVVTFVKGRGEGIADIDLTYAGEDLFSCSYTSYFNNDRGNGVLYLTSDGCALIGKFRSTKDRTNIGAFNLIRCSWNGQE